MKAAERYMLFAVFLLALGMRLWGLADDRWYRADDRVIVDAARNYIEHGHFKPDDWIHPPFKYLLLRASEMLFGDNAYGWRMKNVLLGSLTVFALFLLGRELFSDSRTGIAAALFLAIEPVHVMYSTTVYEEIPATFFFLLSLYFTVRYLKGKRQSLLPAGALFGLAFALKWYYPFALAALVLFLLAALRRDGRLSWSSGAHAAAALVLIPCGIYLLTYYPWIRNGYSLAEFFRMQADAYRILQASGADTFVSAFFRSAPSDARDWFIRPLVYGRMTGLHGTTGQFQVLMSDFPVWLLTLPAALFTAWRAFREKNRGAALALALFAVMYLQFALIRRPMFLYSAIVVLPFVYLFVAFFLVSLMKRYGGGPWSYGTLLSAAGVWGLYLYPLVTERAVSLSFYAPLLSWGGLVQ